MIRQAFTVIGSRHLLGGHNYLRNVLSALKNSPESRIEPVLFAGSDVAEEDVQAFAPLLNSPVIRSEGLDASRRGAGLMRALALGTNGPLADLYRQEGIDLVFEPATFYGWRFPLPAIAWMPDFQHRHLPHMFTKAQYWKREVGFRAQIASGRTIMLSSETSRQECERFYPASKGRTVAAPFAAQVQPDMLTLDALAVVDKYRLPGNFFFLPNQFWRHKNHVVVLEALKLLRQRGRDVVVAASGHTGDFRHPEWFGHIQKLIRDYCLEENFRILGVIPYGDLICLMRAAQGVVNPSLSEGWSTPVEEAKSLGTPLILSSLAVHREQAADIARFFAPDAPEELADILGGFPVRTPCLGPQLPAALRTDFERRRDFFAQRLNLAATMALAAGDARSGEPRRA